MDMIQILSVCGSLLLLGAIIYFVRSDKLKIQYSIIWIFTSAVILLFSLNRTLLEEVAKAFNVHYPPSFLFLLGNFFVLVILLHFSLVISKLSGQNKILTQELMILKKRVEDYAGKK